MLIKICIDLIKDVNDVGVIDDQWFSSDKIPILLHRIVIATGDI